ncbi:glycosyltransferase family 4 protein [Halogeometricum limi]|uniref:Glycosyltransferase involved in cell wall bisynthesis n=1 Tax=Halogeometricum limi TaxID=555875 RepID=A0A1I6IJP0_9EURY|nr:glycosyltransferase family 4 protein [Halogeometricum limi]SFR66901.1 Glycosyltransferase involved in cell wall bisynthesis [Halogeometricum limi]
MSDTNADKEFALVTEYFHPDTASTGQLMTELAVGLEDRGLDMTVYTSQPNYHSGSNDRQPRTSVHDGVLVKRIRAPQFRQSSLPRRLFNWAVFTVWMSVALLVSRPRRERELVFVSNPPMLPVAMWAVAKLRGWEYTYVVYDLYPDQPVELGYLSEDDLVTRLWSRLHQYALHDAAHVVVLGPVMRERVIRRAGPGFDPEKVEIIHNWEDETFIEPREKADNWFSDEHGLVEPFTVFYSGNIAHFHDLETVVEAAAELEDEEVQFLIIGEGDNKRNIVELAERLGVKDETVKFLPYQDWDDLPYSLTCGDVSIVAVREGFEGVCVSSKLYTSMAAGTPVLCIAQPDDDESRIVREADAGITVAQGDVQGVVEAVRRWRDDPELVEIQGRNAREAFEQNFTATRSIDAYYEVLSGTAPEPVSREYLLRN